MSSLWSFCTLQVEAGVSRARWNWRTEIIQYSTVQYNTIRYDTVRYNTIRYTWYIWHMLQDKRTQKPWVNCSNILASTIVRTLLDKVRSINIWQHKVGTTWKRDCHTPKLSLPAAAATATRDSTLQQQFWRHDHMWWNCEHKGQQVKSVLIQHMFIHVHTIYTQQGRERESPYSRACC